MFDDKKAEIKKEYYNYPYGRKTNRWIPEKTIWMGNMWNNGLKTHRYLIWLQTGSLHDYTDRFDSLFKFDFAAFQNNCLLWCIEAHPGKTTTKPPSFADRYCWRDLDWIPLCFTIFQIYIKCSGVHLKGHENKATEKN